MSKLHNLTFNEFYEKYKAGEIQPVTDTVEITQEMNDTFKKLTRSTVKFHDDAQLAKELGYEGNVSYSLLYEIVAVAAGEAMIGENAIDYERNVLFRKPLFVGDVPNIKCEISKVIRAIKTVVQKITITDASGETKSDIVVKIKFLK